MYPLDLDLYQIGSTKGYFFMHPITKISVSKIFIRNRDGSSFRKDISGIDEFVLEKYF